MEMWFNLLRGITSIRGIREQRDKVNILPPSVCGLSEYVPGSILSSLSRDD